MITKANPCVRTIIIDELGSDVMRGLDKLGVITISQDYYSHLIEVCALQKDYLKIIRALCDGHDSIFQREMAHALAPDHGPTRSHRSGAAPVDQPTPQPRSNRGPASGRSRKTSTPKAGSGPAQS